MHFEKYVSCLPCRLAPAVYFLKEFHAVHRLYETDIRKDQFELVGLEVAYELPLYLRALAFQLPYLPEQLLRPAFRETSLPGGIGLFDG